MANLEYEQRHGHDLLLGKLEALDTVDATLAKDELTEDEVLAWLGSLERDPLGASAPDST